MKNVKFILLTAAIITLLIQVGFAASRRLPNGYKVDPFATQIVEDLAKVFKGYSELRKSGSGCDVIEVKYAEVDGQDKVYQWVVKQADKNGNWDGIATSPELKKLFDSACQNRGK